MRSIIYISTRAKRFTDETLQELVQASSKRNSADAITGCLVYNGMNFIQLLEGDHDKLSDCMARIEQDDRHTGIVIIRDAETQSRECAEWGMTGRSVSAKPGKTEQEDIARMLGNASPETVKLFTSFSSL